MKMYKHILLVSIVCTRFFFVPMLANSEQWNIVLDRGQGNGSCTFIKQQDGTITADGNWNNTDSGTYVYGTYVGAAVTIEETSISIKATGIATIPSAPSGYNTSPYVLIINGKALDGVGNGTYQMAYSNPFWSPNNLSGIWHGTRTSGSGITAESKTVAIPWVNLLLKE